jgi:hypothetical protein
MLPIGRFRFQISVLPQEPVLRFDFTEMRLFLAVLEQGSVTGAARL